MQDNMLDQDSQTDLIIATRLYSALLALMTATPVITISYQPKSWGIMKMLDLENCCFDISDLNPKTVIGSIEKLLDSGREIRGRIDRAVEEMRTSLTSVMEEVLPKPPPEQS